MCAGKRKCDTLIEKHTCWTLDT